MWQQTRPSLLEIMAWCLFSAKPLSEPMLVYCQLIPSEQISVKSESKYEDFDSRKYTWKYRLPNGGHFVSASICLVTELFGATSQLGDASQGCVVSGQVSSHDAGDGEQRFLGDTRHILPRVRDPVTVADAVEPLTRAEDTTETLKHKPWWRHSTESSQHYLPFMRGIHLWPVESQ